MARQLSFNVGKVRTLLGQSKRATQRFHPYQQLTDDVPCGPGLFLVGDAGVYLMTNAVQPKPTMPYCMARQADPDRVGPAKADDVKRATFGADDGVEYMDAATVETWIAGVPDDQEVSIKLSPSSMALIKPQTA